MVGRMISAKCAELGHDVRIGTRDVEALMSRSDPDRMGNVSFAEWAQSSPSVTPATFAEAATHGEIVINATNGTASIEALTAAGADNLAGKVLIDVSNPLDFS